MNWRRIYPILEYLLFFGISAIWIGPLSFHLGDVPFHPNAKYTDLLISHWPNAFFIRAAWQEWGSFPLWNPQILSGAPLAADPLFGIWYPPNWLTLILPISIGLNLIFWLHLGWGGLGMYYLARTEGVDRGGAIIAGILFSGMPKLIGHLALGHIGLVSAVCWSPWALWAMRRAVESLSSNFWTTMKASALSGIILGLAFLADPRWSLPLGGLVIVHGGIIFVRKKIYRQVHFSRPCLAVIAFGLFLLGIIAGQAIPLMEYTLRSTRLDLSSQELTDRSLNFSDLIGLVVPGYAGNPETMTSLSIIGIGLVLLAALLQSKRWVYWIGVSCVGLVLALGEHTPFYPWLLSIIPGLRMIRVPARFIFLTFLAFSVLAGMGFDRLNKLGDHSTANRRIRLGVVGYCSLLLIFAIGGGVITTQNTTPLFKPWIHMGLGAISLLLLIFVVRWKVQNRLTQSILWGVILIIDLMLIDHTLIEIRSSENVFSEKGVVAAQFEPEAGKYRVFSPSYSLPQHIAAANGLQLAEGVNPLQLRTYWEYMARAIGFPVEDYSVTLPPFPLGDPSAAQDYEIDTQALGLLNIGFVVSEFPLEADGLIFLKQVDGAYVYENRDIRPRAWVERDSTGKKWEQVQSLSWSPNHIQVVVQGEGMLVLSEVVYPGWVATIDGKQVLIELSYELLRSISLGQGEHLVDLYFRPWSVIVGAALTIIAFFSFLFLWWRH